MNKLSELHTDCITNNRKTLRIRWFWRASDWSRYPNQSMKVSSSPLALGCLPFWRTSMETHSPLKKKSWAFWIWEFSSPSKQSFMRKIFLWEKLFKALLMRNTNINILQEGVGMYISVPTCYMFVDTYISHYHTCKHFNQRELIGQPDHK